MKTKLAVTTVALFTLVQSLYAQTADDYVSQGRAFLAATNLPAANNSFANAAASSPNHQTANVLYAATRLLVLPSQPAGSNFLNRLGMPIAGRSIYNWTAQLPADTNGVPLAPVGMNANESAAMLRTNVLPALIAAETNLAIVTDTNFTLSLTSDETRMVSVTLDYGDVLMLRAMLHAAEYSAYTAYSWNHDAQLSVIRALITEHQLSIGGLLMDYPDLLTFAHTNDLGAAKLAFQNGVDCYLQASQFIRSRLTNVTRLFNYDPGSARDEEKFRLTITDLKNSLNGAVPLAVDTNYTVFFSAHFNGAHALRSFLPVFRGNSFALATLPDPTFGGLIYGITRQEADAFLAEHLLSIPTIAPGSSVLETQFQFPISVAEGRGYVVQVSTNLLNWADYAAFVSLGGQYEFADPNAYGLPRRFYRVVDRTDNMPPPVNDDFDNRALIPGLNVPVVSYTDSASRQPGEPDWSWRGHTIWWTWISPVSAEVAVRATGGSDCWQVAVFTGTSVDGLTQVGNGNGQFHFNAQAGIAYQVAVDTCWQDGGLRLVITQPPVLAVGNPPDGAVFTAPASIPVSATASDPDGQIRQIAVSAWSNLDFDTTGGSFNFLWTNVPGGDYFLSFTATDDVGAQVSASRSIRVAPPNDNFTNAKPISGAPLAVSGSNTGSNKEPGEPNHAGDSGNASVWWAWSPTTTGPVTILCDVTNQWSTLWPLLGVYTGNTITNLAPVASNTPAYGSTAMVSFMASAGQNYRIAVDSSGTGDVVLQFILTAAPSVAITNPPNNASFVGPTNVQISAQASDPDGSIARVDFFADGSLIGTAVSPPYSLIWSNAPPSDYARELVAVAVDNTGVGVYSVPVYVTIKLPPPPNDNFANRIPFVGTNVTVSGTTVGATAEPGEPYHGGWYLNRSIWWSWQATKTGQVILAVAGSDYSSLVAGVYTGSAIGSLSLVASGRHGDWPYSTCAVSFDATAGTTYAIAVDSGGNAGPVTLSLTQP